LTWQGQREQKLFEPSFKDTSVAVALKSQGCKQLLVVQGGNDADALGVMPPVSEHESAVRTQTIRRHSHKHYRCLTHQDRVQSLVLWLQSPRGRLAAGHRFVLDSRRSFFASKANFVQSSRDSSLAHWSLPSLGHFSLSLIAMFLCKLAKLLPIGDGMFAASLIASLEPEAASRLSLLDPLLDGLTMNRENSPSLTLAHTAIYGN